MWPLKYHPVRSYLCLSLSHHLQILKGEILRICEDYSLILYMVPSRNTYFFRKYYHKNKDIDAYTHVKKYFSHCSLMGNILTECRVFMEIVKTSIITKAKVLSL